MWLDEFNEGKVGTPVDRVVVRIAIPYGRLNFEEGPFWVVPCEWVGEIDWLIRIGVAKGSNRLRLVRVDVVNEVGRRC